MRFEDYIRESQNNKSITNHMKKIWDMPYKRVMSLLKSNWKQFKKEIEGTEKEEQVINSLNRHLKTKFTSLSDIDRLRVNESQLNESFKNWWSTMIGETLPSLLFFPMLTVFLEINKFLTDTGGSVKLLAFYSVLYILIVTGKYEHIEWKKRKEKEFEKSQMNLPDKPARSLR